MCGIVAAVGNNNVVSTLVEGLRRLEYRGYDSAGLSVTTAGDLVLRRAVGPLRSLEGLLEVEPIAGRCGVAHTRWATHGAATVANSHPHASFRCAVVHNGIIENHKELKQDLEAAGIRFRSDTDSEVIPWLVEVHLTQGFGPKEAVRATLAKLEGMLAIAVLFPEHENLLIAARRGSPLCVGRKTGQTIVASDATALSGVVDGATYLEDGDLVVVQAGRFQLFDRDDSPKTRKIHIVRTAEAATYEGYEDFTRKEIFEQPLVIARQRQASSQARFPEVLGRSEVTRLRFIACGTSRYAAMVAKTWFQRLAGVAVDVEIASEFRYGEPLFDTSTFNVFVSQSGETADTLACLRLVKQFRQPTFALVNVAQSSMVREADYHWLTQAGSEIGVASTKAFTAQLMALCILALRMGQARRLIDETCAQDLLEEMHRLPELMEIALRTESSIRKVSKTMTRGPTIFLGRGMMYPLALEGALKLKELSYLPASGYAAGEMKHGPIALVDAETPVVVLAPSIATRPKTLANIEEVAARGAKVVLIESESATDSTDSIRVPEVSELLAPLVYAVPLQLLAYHVAKERGLCVDKPRNLAKSVTVE